MHKSHHIVIVTASGRDEFGAGAGAPVVSTLHGRAFRPFRRTPRRRLVARCRIRSPSAARHAEIGVNTTEAGENQGQAARAHPHRNGDGGRDHRDHGEGRAPEASTSTATAPTARGGSRASSCRKRSATRSRDRSNVIVSFDATLSRFRVVQDYNNNDTINTTDLVQYRNMADGARSSRSRAGAAPSARTGPRRPPPFNGAGLDDGLGPSDRHLPPRRLGQRRTSTVFITTNAGRAHGVPRALCIRSPPAERPLQVQRLRLGQDRHHDEPPPRHFRTQVRRARAPPRHDARRGHDRDRDHERRDDRPREVRRQFEHVTAKSNDMSLASDLAVRASSRSRRIASIRPSSRRSTTSPRRSRRIPSTTGSRGRPSRCAAPAARRAPTTTSR